MNLRRLALGAVPVAAAVALVPVWHAAAAPTASGASTTPPLCRLVDVEYYYGGQFAGLGQRAFQITLLAHDAVTCRLGDKPLISFVGPDGTPAPITVYRTGRGGTLVLSPSAPLHTTVSYYAADAPDDTTNISNLVLSMPGPGGSKPPTPTPLEYPGTVAVATNPGISVSAWTTGIGAGEQYG